MSGAKLRFLQIGRILGTRFECSAFNLNLCVIGFCLAGPRNSRGAGGFIFVPGWGLGVGTASDARCGSLAEAVPWLAALNRCLTEGQMSSQLNSFQEFGSADDVGDVEFAAFDPESGDSAAVAARNESVAEAVPPNWFKRKANADAAPTRSDNPAIAVRESASEPAELNAMPSQFTLVEPPPLPSKKSKFAKPAKPAIVAPSRKPVAEKSGKPSPKDKKSGAALVVAESDGEDEKSEPLKWHQHFVRWFKTAAAGAYGVSLIFHFLLLLSLSLVIYSTLDDNDAISMTMSDEDGLPMNLEDTVLLETALSGGQVDSMPQFKQVLLSDASQSETSMDIASMLGSGEGSGGGDDDGFAFKMPTGGGVTKKGSFAAWTVPKDPKPGQEYQIVIRVQLPKSSRQYRVDDLSGTVIGTDGYRLSIPFDNRNPSATKAEKNDRLLPVSAGDYLRIIDDHVQLVVAVPGGASLVKDTIEVRSKRLKEEQRLEIEF